MDEKATNHVQSAAAFVEGGIQEACDDACSICLEPFCEGDPSTVTGCKHEFHLQCILEWCQRSSQCPMCWQPISFKDSTSQELLEAVEKERNLRFTRPRNAAIFHHPSLGDFELQHLPVGANDADLEERIFQHLAAAAAMGRAHLARREGRRGRSGTHGRPQYFVFSADANTVPPSASSAQRGLDSERIPASASVDHSSPGVGENISSHASHPISIRSPQVPLLISGSDNTSINDRNSPSQREEGAGPSDFHSFSESLKSRFCAASTKYKESIAKATKGWKERLFSRSTNVADSASENRVEVAPHLTTISNMMERLDTREASPLEGASVRHHVEGHLVAEPTTSSPIERHENMKRDLNTTPYCATSSDSS